jgi:hypothetical protein
MQTSGLPLTVAWRVADADRMALDVATPGGRVELVAALPPPRADADRWAEVELRARSRSDAVGFVEALAAWLGIPLGTQRVGKHNCVRGRMLVQAYGPGLLTSKLSFGDGEQGAEVYFNVRGERGELTPKDDAYVEALVTCFALGFGVADGAKPRPALAPDADTLLDQMRRGGEVESWAASANGELLARLRTAMDDERASPPARHSFLRINGATLLLRLGEPDASPRFAEGVLDERRSVSRTFLASLSRITDGVRPSLDPRYATRLDAEVLGPALDTITSRYASSSERPDVHDRDLAERVRARLVERR